MILIMYVVLNGKLQIVKYFFEKGVDLFLEDNNGWNLLYFVLEGGDFEVIDLFLNYVFNVELRIVVGITSLMIVIRNGKLNVIKFFFQKGVDLIVEDKMGKNFLYYVLLYDLEVMKLFQSYMVNCYI